MKKGMIVILVAVLTFGSNLTGMAQEKEEKQAKEEKARQEQLKKMAAEAKAKADAPIEGDERRQGAEEPAHLRVGEQQVRLAPHRLQVEHEGQAADDHEDHRQSGTDYRQNDPPKDRPR